MNIYNSTVSLINLLVLLACLVAVDGASSCFASSVILQWDPNTEADLAGYKIYYRTDNAGLPFHGVGAIEGPSPVDVHNRTTATISGLDPGQDYYFALTAYNRYGIESGFSNIVTIPKLTPSALSISTPKSPPSIPFTYNDAMLALRAATGQAVLTAVEAARLDVAPVVNGVSAPNGKIDAGDALVILARTIAK